MSRSPTHMTKAAVQVAMIGGNCPVQAEGTVDGAEFYFRARGRRWALYVATDGGDPLDNGAWVYHEHYDIPGLEGPGGDAFAAGWMEESEARAFIAKAAQIYHDRSGRDA